MLSEETDIEQVGFHGQPSFQLIRDLQMTLAQYNSITYLLSEQLWEVREFEFIIDWN
jgi:hypothetical protein